MTTFTTPNSTWLHVNHFSRICSSFEALTREYDRLTSWSARAKIQSIEIGFIGMLRTQTAGNNLTVTLNKHCRISAELARQRSIQVKSELVGFGNLKCSRKCKCLPWALSEQRQCEHIKFRLFEASVKASSLELLRRFDIESYSQETKHFSATVVD